MNCNCSNWDDESPCKIHGNTKLTVPEVWHHTKVIHIIRTRATRKWHYTVAIDSIQVFRSRDFDTKQACQEAAGWKTHL